MFRELFGLPAHALIVHAAVVFIPLAAVGAILYVLWPALRRPTWWAVLALGVAAPLTAWAARLSGQEYRTYWVNHGAGGDFLAQIDRHQSLGNLLSWWAIGFGVAVVITVLYAIPARVGQLGAGSAPTRVVQLVAAVVTLALAGVTLYYVIRTGDAGAHLSHVEDI